MIVEGHYVQPCVYDSGIWVTLMCPHKYTEAKQIILKDAKYIQYENKEGIFKWTEDLDETK
jgi:hypothetical protein